MKDIATARQRQRIPDGPEMVWGVAPSPVELGPQGVVLVM